MLQTPPPFQDLIHATARIVLGKEQEIRLALCCLLAGGHLLIEDLPGLGKTTLAHTLASLCGLDFKRMQFTADLLPADILGVSIFEREHSQFRFLPGPIFTQILLADEINRATPKTQSALLEAMEEQQVTIEGETRALPQPFFVIATQNPNQQIGTFPLPESQLDRFLMRLSLGYPAAQAEHQLLTQGDARRQLKTLAALMTAERFIDLQQQASTVRCAPALIDYLQALLAASRQSSEFAHGLSPRAGLSLPESGRASAFLDGRDFVLPEDLQRIFPAVSRHRLRTTAGQVASAEHIEQLLRDTAIP